MGILYDTQPWRDYRSRVLSADAECALAHLAGGCQGALHVHHVKPLAEGGPEFPCENGTAVLCARHHALVHAWRKKTDSPPRRKRCSHNHRYDWARRECERKLNSRY